MTKQHISDSRQRMNFRVSLQLFRTIVSMACSAFHKCFMSNKNGIPSRVWYFDNQTIFHDKSYQQNYIGYHISPESTYNSILEFWKRINDPSFLMLVFDLQCIQLSLKHDFSKQVQLELCSLCHYIPRKFIK